MEGGSSDIAATGEKASELEALQKEHEEKTLKIQELKIQIELTKNRLEKRKKEVNEENIGGFNTLSNKYNSLREEYNAMLAEKPKE
ncbi:hypothetical protein TanjilG_16394 [Lupinus angustifolius]|uniref:Uncharacterized protein n=1 Tax=Lupinus angustifolius TaxID=3871 RepID=A0A1J7I423_LUPAN|nr:hypothetical protein TanjilG_16394 [Lupinus angustifolius]